MYTGFLLPRLVPSTAALVAAVLFVGVGRMLAVVVELLGEPRHRRPPAGRARACRSGPTWGRCPCVASNARVASVYGVEPALVDREVVDGEAFGPSLVPPSGVISERGVIAYPAGDSVRQCLSHRSVGFLRRRSAMADYKIELTPDLFAEPVELGLAPLPPGRRHAGDRHARCPRRRRTLRDPRLEPGHRRLPAGPPSRGAGSVSATSTTGHCNDSRSTCSAGTRSRSPRTRTSSRTARPTPTSCARCTASSTAP